MADAGRLTPHKSNQNADAAAETQRTKQGPETADKPPLKVTFERPETRDALKSVEKALPHVILVPEPAPPESYSTASAGSRDARTGSAVALLDKPDAAKAAGTGTEERRETVPRETPSTGRMLGTPLLAIVAALATLAAGWSYMKLNEARQQLATATAAIASASGEKALASEARATAEKAIASATADVAAAAQVKASAEKALTDAQSRLSALEMSVAEIKTAIAAVMTSVAPTVPASAPAGTSPAK